MSKQKIQDAFNAVGFEMMKLVDAIKEHGHLLNDQEFDAGFRFLRRTLGTCEAMGNHARRISLAASMSFTFDMEIMPHQETPSEALLTSQSVTTGQTPSQPQQASQAQQGVRAVGRLVKEAQTNGADRIVFDIPETPRAFAEDPSGDGITFIDK
jgi:hypothetical protein